MYALVIENGTVYDGTGSKPLRADVAVMGAEIAVDDLSKAEEKRRLDDRGRIVAAGFIDLHTHNDGPNAKTPTAESCLREDWVILAGDVALEHDVPAKQGFGRLIRQGES